jgi:transcriptional regulator with XRE-family HTH domain
MNGQTPLINGALLRMRREELGWALADLATRACLSSKQVKQIEEGGTSSFYSETVKVTAAKKIGGILGLTEESIFVVQEPDELRDEANATEVAEVSESTGYDSSATNPDIASPAVKPYLKSPSIETTVIQKSTNSALDSEDKPKPKNSLWYIIALFVAALGLAAVMQKPVMAPPAEPPPPIQVLPSDQADSAVSAPAEAASSVAPMAPVAAPATPPSNSSAPVTAPAPVAPVARPAVVTTPAPAPVTSPASSTPPASQ